MSKIWLSTAIGAVALLGLPGTSPAQHDGREVRPGGRGGYSREAYQPGYSGYGDYGRSYYGGYGRGYYGSGFGPYIGPRYGYGYPYYGGSYYNQPSYSYPSYNYVQPSYGYVEPSIPTPYPPAAPPSAGLSEDQDPNAAMLEVRVPENAQLWFAGARTSQTGPVRHFVSPSLPPGRTFTYEIRARWTDASGRSVDRTKRVEVRAGARVGVDFNS
jgi:uncharacterized protein (TIGR03000 family)